MLKTNQFIKEIKSMGFDVKELHYNLEIYEGNEFTLAHVSKKEVGVLATDFPNFYSLEHDRKLRLLDLLIEYAKTPIEDRKEEEKYYLRHKGLRNGNNTLNLQINSQKYHISDEFEHPDYKNQFTQSEIDDMPECYKHPAVWEKIKVEDAKNEN